MLVVGCAVPCCGTRWTCLNSCCGITAGNAHVHVHAILHCLCRRRCCCWQSRWQHNASSPAGCTACWCMWHHAQQAGAPSQTLSVCAFLCGGLLLLVLAGCSFGCNPLFRAYCIVKGRVSAAPVYCAVWWVQCVPAIAASACMPNEWLPGSGCRHVGSGRYTFTGFKVQQPAYTVTT